MALSAEELSGRNFRRENDSRWKSVPRFDCVWSKSAALPGELRCQETAYLKSPGAWLAWTTREGYCGWKPQLRGIAIMLSDVPFSGSGQRA